MNSYDCYAFVDTWKKSALVVSWTVFSSQNFSTVPTLHRLLEMGNTIGSRSSPGPCWRMQVQINETSQRAETQRCGKGRKKWNAFNRKREKNLRRWATRTMSERNGHNMPCRFEKRRGELPFWNIGTPLWKKASPPTRTFQPISTHPTYTSHWLSNWTSLA